MLRLIWSFWYCTFSRYSFLYTYTHTYTNTQRIYIVAIFFRLILFVKRFSLTDMIQTLAKIICNFTRKNKFCWCNQTDFLNEFLVRCMMPFYYTYTISMGSASISFLFLYFFLSRIEIHLY